MRYNPVSRIKRNIPRISVSELKDGATLIQVKHKLWKDYQKGTNSIFHDINGNRQIWEVEVNLPKGQILEWLIASEMQKPKK